MAITKIQFTPQAHKVKEGSSFGCDLTFYDGLDLVAPTTVRYQLADDDGEAVVDWTTASAATTVSLTIPASVNLILDEDNIRERRFLTVEAAATTTAVVDGIHYDLINRYGL